MKGFSKGDLNMAVVRSESPEYDLDEWVSHG